MGISEECRKICPVFVPRQQAANRAFSTRFPRYPALGGASPTEPLVKIDDVHGTS
jgi:hypothetical protein